MAAPERTDWRRRRKRGGRRGVRFRVNTAPPVSTGEVKADMRKFEKTVAAWGIRHSRTLGLEAGRIEARSIWNPGGFVNLSFLLTDGNRRFHVKLAPADRADGLRRWVAAGDLLAREYAAPRIVDTISQEMIPGYPFGLVTEYVDGRPMADAPDAERIVPEVMRTISRLHRDRRIAGLVGRRAGADRPRGRTYAEAFMDMYISRFEEDLETVLEGRALLGFVAREAFEWFRGEIERLREAAERSPLFAGQARDVAHQDLNWHNVLTDGSGGFWIIDWDDLTADGDAAADYSVFLWPLRHTPSWPALRETAAALAGGETAERMRLYERANLFDEVIDSLADYVEAERAPDFREAAQSRARAVHERAYPLYRQWYG